VRHADDVARGITLYLLADCVDVVSVTALWRQPTATA
jgi:hypothetical protein